MSDTPSDGERFFVSGLGLSGTGDTSGGNTQTKKTSKRRPKSNIHDTVSSVSATRHIAASD